MKKSSKYLLIGFLILCLGASGFLNVYLLRVNKRVRNSVVYSLTDDFLLNQIMLTKAAKESENSTTESTEKEGIIPLVGDKKGNSTEEDLPSDSKEIVSVPKTNQLPDYPNGCEAASTTMLLNYYGIHITLKEFIDQYLPMQEVYNKDGSRFGPDPSLYYAGNPASARNGWGCYEPVIENALNKLIANKNLNYLKVQNLNQKPLKELFNSTPVVIWIADDYSQASDFVQWYSYDKTKTYTYSNKTHAVVLVGYDIDNYYIADPLKEEEVTKVNQKQLEESYDSLGRQAVTLYNSNY